jgi:hypothetical protein
MFFPAFNPALGFDRAGFFQSIVLWLRALSAVTNARAKRPAASGKLMAAGRRTVKKGRICEAFRPIRLTAGRSFR